MEAGLKSESGFVQFMEHHLDCDFVSLHTNTQICIRQFSIMQKFFHLRNRILCVFLSKNWFFW
jgi:hypothetical protein